MKKKTTLFMTTLLASTVIFAGLAYAEAQKTTAPQKEVVNTTTVRTVRPLAIDGKTHELKPAIQRFIERINLARYAMSVKDTPAAVVHLDEAEKHLKFIKDNSRVEEVSEKTVIASGRVTSDTTEAFNSYYVPLEEGPVVVKTLEETGKQKGQNISGLAVKSVDLVYLNVDLTGQQAPQYIATARTALKSGDLRAADKALGDMIDAVATTSVVDAMPMEKAYDNLRLSLKFLQDDNYSASRHALDHARNALKEAKADAKYGQSDIDSIRSKLDQIHGLVMQSTSEAAQKARVQMIAVKNQMEDMRS